MGKHLEIVTWYTPDLPEPHFVARCRKEVDFMFKMLSDTKRKVIIQYLKDFTGNRIGCLVAYKAKDSNDIKIGWSALNTEKDRWNKYVGLFHAFRRSMYNYSENLPPVVYDEIGAFYDRCLKYFLNSATLVN